MKHLKLFKTQAEFDSAILELPNVSYIEENLRIYYNPKDVELDETSINLLSNVEVTEDSITLLGNNIKIDSDENNNYNIIIE